MGFVPQRKQYRLKFKDHELDGLEVTVASASIGTLLGLSEMSTESPEHATERLERSIQVLAEALVSWNIENAAGEPTPATVDGLKQQDMSLVMAIISAWTEAVSGVAPPLPGGSDSGETFPEGSLPMAVLSPNQES
jgi:hypothetical protein